MNNPNESKPAVSPKTGLLERDERPVAPERHTEDFCMDIPRAGAAERLAAAERKRRAGR